MRISYAFGGVARVVNIVVTESGRSTEAQLVSSLHPFEDQTQESDPEPFHSQNDHTPIETRVMQIMMNMGPARPVNQSAACSTLRNDR